MPQERRLIGLTTDAIGAGGSDTQTYTAEEDYTIEKILIQQQGTETAAARDTVAAIDVDGVLISKPDASIMAFLEEYDRSPVIGMPFGKGSKLTAKLTSTTGGTFYITLVCKPGLA